MKCMTCLFKHLGESQRVWEELKKVIPGGVNSPARAFKNIAINPIIADFGKGCHLTDVDGNRYIDYCGSWGALLHGHAHPEIVKATKAALDKGFSFGVSTEIEAEFAKKLISFLPYIDQVRCVNSGTEATMTAARMARGITQKRYLIKFSGCYHGHADLFLVEAGSGVVLNSTKASSSGVLQDAVSYTLSLPFNDLKAIDALYDNQEIIDDLAGVIVEPIAGNMGVIPATQEFLIKLRALCNATGAVLIFDEVMTGFRVSKQGAFGIYKIAPDLVCLGKIIGGGFPVGAVAGRQEIMQILAPQGTVYQAGTLSGNPVAMTAGYQALEILDRPGFYEDMEEKMSRLINPIRAFILKHDLNAYMPFQGSMTTLFIGAKKIRNFDEVKSLSWEVFASFFNYMYQKGIYIPQSPFEAWFVSSAHGNEEIDFTVDTILQYLRKLLL